MHCIHQAHMQAAWQVKHTLGMHRLRGQSHDSPVTPQPALPLSTPTRLPPNRKPLFLQTSYTSKTYTDPGGATYACALQLRLCYPRA